jgi:hypothetical protein
MPNAKTFRIPPIKKLLAVWLGTCSVVVDPFARNSRWGTITNDLDPETIADYHLPADEFVKTLAGTVLADAVLFDPPYSPTQMIRAYKGRANGQTAKLYKAVKDGLDVILRPGGIAISFGWSSGGFGKTRGYELLEVHLVNHGGAHNDTIVTIERKAKGQS